MSRGLVSPQLPYIRKKAVELLKADYPDRDTAKRKITDGVTGYYRANYPEIYNPKRALVEQSAENVAAICCAFDISSLDSVGPGVLRNQMSGALAHASFSIPGPAGSGTRPFFMQRFISIVRERFAHLAKKSLPATRGGW
jgi:hypothetical protein